MEYLKVNGTEYPARFCGKQIDRDCEIRVPAALVDAWKAATNWATYADHIVGV